MSLADQEYLSIVKNILDKGALGENRTGMLPTNCRIRSCSLI